MATVKKRTEADALCIYFGEKKQWVLPAFLANNRTGFRYNPQFICGSGKNSEPAESDSGGLG